MSITRHIDRNDQIYINVRITVTMGKRRLPGVTTTETYDNGVNKKRTIENCDPKIYGVNSSLTYQEVCKLFNIKRLPQISSFGRIKKNGRIVQGKRPHANGYVDMDIYGFTRSVHVCLLASAGARPSAVNEITVEHKTVGIENRSINHLDKLVLMSSREQVISSYKNNKSRTSNAAQCERPILYKKVGTSEWLKYRSGCAFARDFNINQGNVSTCLAKRRKHCGGYELTFDTQQLYDGELKMPVIIDGKMSGAYVTNMSRFIDTFGVLKTIKPSCDTDGKRKSVRINSKHYQFSVIVYAAFNKIILDSTTESIGNGMQVNHKDGDHNNDSPENLEEIDPITHASHSAQIKGRISGGIRRRVPLLGKDVSATSWTEFSDVYDASEHTGILAASIKSAKDHMNKNGTRQTRVGINDTRWEFKSVEYPTDQNNIDGEIWFDIYPKHAAPYYFKRLAESIFTCQVCPE